MARRRVTYLEVAGGRPHEPLVSVELRPPGTGPPLPPPPPLNPPTRHRRRYLVVAVALVAVAVVATTISPSEPPPAAGPDRAAPFLPSLRFTAGPVPIETRGVVDPPWRGVFEHHPALDVAPDVDTVHVFALHGEGPRPASALLVVDATRRANTRGEHPTVRVLGRSAGRGLRTLLWDDGGYGLALTSVGLRLIEQERLAAGVLVPGGPSLVHGRRPTLDAAALGGLGLVVVGTHSGPATSIGGPIIGQSGVASIEGHLHRRASGVLLVSVVRSQVVSARTVAHALRSSVAVDVAGLEGVEAAAVLAHPGPTTTFTRVRGWTRLLLDLGDDVTVELSSDVLGTDGLLAAAGSLDLGRLARTVRVS